MEPSKNNYKKAVLFIALSTCTALTQYAGEPTQATKEIDKKCAHLYYTYTERITGFSYNILSIPKNLEDKEWKSLFEMGKHSQKDEKALADKIESFVQAFQKNEKSEDFVDKEKNLLKFLVGYLAPTIKSFELGSIPTNNKKNNEAIDLYIINTGSCDCCEAGRYHIQRDSTNSTLVSCDDHSVTASASVKIAPFTVMQKNLKKIYSIAPYLHKQLTDKTFERMLTLATLHYIWILSHEMAHIARLDDLEGLKNLDSSPLLQAEKTKLKEHQADLIASLILQSEQSFLATINAFAQEFIVSLGEQVDWLLHIDSEENDDPLEKLVMFHDKEPSFTTFPDYMRRAYIFKKKDTYRSNNSTHPPYFQRIQQTLTTWAAYLMHAHAEPFTKSEAVKHITKACINLFNQYGISNETIKDLLYKIVDDWAAAHLPVTP